MQHKQYMYLSKCKELFCVIPIIKLYETADYTTEMKICLTISLPLKRLYEYIHKMQTNNCFIRHN